MKKQEFDYDREPVEAPSLLTGSKLYRKLIEADRKARLDKAEFDRHFEDQEPDEGDDDEQ